MPMYVFRCDACGASTELLLPLGATGERACEACGGAMRHRFGRVAVKYQTWGFTSTDRLVREPGRRDFKALRDKAEQISDD